MKRSIKYFLIIAALALAVCFVPVKGGSVAHAGVSRVKVASDDMFAEEISDRAWYVRGNIGHEYNAATGKGAIVFNENSTGGSARIISTAFADDLSDKGLYDCLSGSVTLNITALNGEFYVVFGLKEAFYSVGQDNCSAISFSASSGKIAVSVLNIEKTAKTVVKALPAPYSFGSDITLDFTVKADGKVSLSVNGTNHMNCDNAVPCYSKGYFGFAQSAASGVKILSANVVSASYDSPENAEVNETFEDGFDASRIFVNNNDAVAGYYSPEGMSCENGVLKFNNITSYGFVSTCYEFSNFALSFNIPHLQRAFEYDGEGKVVTPASNFFGVSVGAPLMNASHYAITEAVFMYFTPLYAGGKEKSLYLVLLDNYNVLAQIALEGELDFWAEENAYDIYGEEKTVNMKVEMTDGVLTCSFKWENEGENRYRTLISYDLGYTPLGYVQIHGQGYTASDILKNDSLPCSNFHIDNLKVINTDASPKTIQPEYVDNRMERGRDYDYIDAWNNRIKTVEAFETEEKNASGCGGFSGAGVFVSAALMGISAFTVRRKKDEK